MNKRGLSAVVTVLIIILITIVALGIIWVVVKNLVLEQSELIKDREKYFTEELQIVKLRVEGKQFNITLRKTGGKVETTKEVVQEAIPMDVFSIIDLSGSMSACHSITTECCSDLGGYYLSDGNCYGVNTARVGDCNPMCGGTPVDALTPTRNANNLLVSTVFNNGGSATKMGLVAYATTVGEAESIDLTNNTADLNTVINSWQAYGDSTSGGTCICCGINEATTRLDQQSSEGKTKTMIVMSDGRPSLPGCGGDPVDDTIQAANDAMSELNDLTIYGVGVGENVDEQTLIAIADAGEGEYFSATSIEDLISVYEEIGEKISITLTSTHSYKYILFIFSSATESYEAFSLEFPEILGRKEYEFDLTDKLEGAITKIEIYPTYILDSGKEIIGPLMDSWKPKG